MGKPIMIDRKTRNDLIHDFKAYLNGDGSLRQYHQMIDKLEKYRSSKDEAVAIFIETFEEFYEDATMQGNITEKETWDCHQRLLLVLSSKTQLKKHKLYLWNLFQLVALAIFCIGLYTLINRLNSFSTICYVYLTAYLSSEIINYFIRIILRNSISDKVNLNCYPFTSRSQIRKVLSTTDGFKKMIYDKSSEQNAGIIRTMFGIFLLSYRILGRIAYTPFGLIIQMMPINATWYEVVD